MSEPNDTQQKLLELERQLAAIKTISKALASKTNVDDIVREALEVAVRTLDAQAGSILLSDADKEHLVFKYVVGSKAPQLTERTMSADEGIAGLVFQSGEPAMTRDAAEDEHHLADVDRDLDWQTNTMLTVPLKTLGGGILGVMQALNKTSGEFDEADLELLSVVAAQAATLIDTARLHEKAQLASIVRAMGDIGHDIKNMLTPVVTCAQTLDAILESTFADLDASVAVSEGEPARRAATQVAASTSSLRDFYPEAIEMLLDGAESVQDRVRQLADCVKGHITEPHFETVPVGEIIAKVVRTLDVVAKKKGVTLSVEGVDDIPPFPLDSKQIYTAFYNLISNAIPETPAGGSITILGGIEKPKEADEPARVSLQVRDTGLGMPEHVRAKLFTDEAISMKPGGTGLGTRIVRNVADVHGGTVSVESEEGKGTTFTLRLPARR